MIQRKQTLFLLLAALLALCTWLFPIATYTSGQAESYNLMTYGLYTADGIEVKDVSMRMPFSIVITILGTALFAAIFMYRNRPRQMRFVRGTYLLILAIIAFMFIGDNSIQAYLGMHVERTFGLSFVLPLVALVLTIMAERGIRADESLVRSMDRLR
jgi:glucose uptake protein GlcU